MRPVGAPKHIHAVAYSMDGRAGRRAPETCCRRIFGPRNLPEADRPAVPERRSRAGLPPEDQGGADDGRAGGDRPRNAGRNLKPREPIRPGPVTEAEAQLFLGFGCAGRPGSDPYSLDRGGLPFSRSRTADRFTNSPIPAAAGLKAKCPIRGPTNARAWPSPGRPGARRTTSAPTLSTARCDCKRGNWHEPRRFSPRFEGSERRSV